MENSLLFSDDNVGFYAHDLSMYYFWLARRYALKRDMKETLEALAHSAEYAVRASERTAGQYTAPMVNRLTDDPAADIKNYKGNVCGIRLDNLKGKAFDFLRENAEFRKIEQELEKHIEE